MCLILIAIGMHTKPDIASLAFTAYNWELLCTDIAIKEIFYCLKHNGAIK